MNKETFERALKINSSINSCSELIKRIRVNFNLNLGGENDGYYTLNPDSKFLRFESDKIDSNDRMRSVLDGKTQDAIFKLITEGLESQIKNLKEEFDNL